MYYVYEVAVGGLKVKRVSETLQLMPNYSIGDWIVYKGPDDNAQAQSTGKIEQLAETSMMISPWSGAATSCLVALPLAPYKILPCAPKFRRNDWVLQKNHCIGKVVDFDGEKYKVQTDSSDTFFQESDLAFLELGAIVRLHHMM